MTRELADNGILSKLVEFYEPELLAVTRDDVTGVDGTLPKDLGALAALLSNSLHRPELILVWGKEIAFSQLDIWRPYITRTSRRVAIFAKSLKGKSQESLGLARVPAYISDTSGALAPLASALPSLTTVLYITDKNENFTYLRWLADKIHVFANHGDSDKHSNMSRLSCAYDFVLVADSNAAMRFVQNGIQLPLDRFVAMGGSVIDGLEARKSFGPVQKLVYAPTWEGYNENVNFSSIDRIAPLLRTWPQAAQALRFRPHPGTGKRSSEAMAAKDELATVCPPRKADAKGADFNWSDAIITDVSGVLSEYLYTRKPIILPVSESKPWHLAYLKGTHLGEYVYFWDYERVSLDAMLEEVSRDPLREARIARRERLYYNASSTEESCRLFDQALDYFELTRKLRSMTNPRHARLGVAAASFERTPSDPALAEIVNSIRAGKLVLTAAK